MDHDELGGRIYQDHLATDSEQCKSPLLARKNPYLISITKIWGGGARSEIGTNRMNCSGVQEPLPWNYLASATSSPMSIGRKNVSSSSKMNVPAVLR